jgi:NAD(P)-dependent dehydrogenase (short-subunit alcohol dehydrogenase family)
MGVLSGKVGLVTGAGQGVGRGIALAMAKEGCAVAITGKTASKLDSVCEEIAAAGGKAIPIACNVRELADIERTVAETVKQLGGLDILVNNAYEGAWGPLLTVDDEAFQLGLFAGPIACFRFMKEAHPHLKKRGDGNIINLVTPASVRWDTSNYGAYGTAKEGMRVLSRTAASEWGKDNIRVNAVAPLANSPALDGWTKNNPQEAEAFFKTVPQGRIGDCEQDIGQAVVLLLRPEARYLTGQTIALDGGQARFG